MAHEQIDSIVFACREMPKSLSEEWNGGRVLNEEMTFQKKARSSNRDSIPSEITFVRAADEEDHGDVFNHEDIIGLKIQVAELQTELEIERNRANKNDNVKALLQENAQLKDENAKSTQKALLLEDKVSRIKKENEEMVSRMVLLIYEIDRLKEGKVSHIQKDSIISTTLRDRIQRIVSVMAEEDASALELKSVFRDTTRRIESRRFSLSDAYQPQRICREEFSTNNSQHPSEKLDGNTIIPRRASSPDLVGDTAAFTSAPFFQNIIRHFRNSISRMHNNESSDQTNTIPTKHVSRRRFEFTDPFGPSSQKNDNIALVNKMSVQNDADENQMYLSFQNTVSFPSEKELRLSDKTDDLTDDESLAEGLGNEFLFGADFGPK